MTYSDIIITVSIVALVLFAMWRGGQQNPVGTGRLARRLNTLEQKVAEQGTRMDGIEKSILAIADNVGQFGVDLSAIRVEVASDRGVTERTWAAVSRLEGFFLQDAITQRGRP